MVTGYSTAHVHQLGYPCANCGYVTVPARFYHRDEKGVELSYEAALADYVAFLKEKPDKYAEVLARIEGTPFRVVKKVPGLGIEDVVTEKVCPDCGGGFEGHGKKCAKCRMRDSRARKA